MASPKQNKQKTPITDQETHLASIPETGLWTTSRPIGVEGTHQHLHSDLIGRQGCETDPNPSQGRKVCKRCGFEYKSGHELNKFKYSNWPTGRQWE